MSARFSLAIDLGTSNSAIAIADLESGETRIIEIAQTLGPNQIGEMPTLPSAVYIPHSDEFPESSFPLPWNDAGERAIIGQFARERGALVPDRLATSAKSWLSNPMSTRSSGSCPGDRTSRKRSSRHSNAHAFTSNISGTRSCITNGRRGGIGTTRKARSL